MPDSIHVKLPDGSVKEVPKGTTALDIAKSISPRLADAALAAKDNGNLIDLTRPLEKDAELRILTDRDPEALQVYRHSSAHLLAAAVLELFPETKLGHGPPTDSGFFYDFYRPTPFTPDDLEKIEKKMHELVQQNIPYAREFLPRDQGLAEFKKEGDFMKCHYIEQFTKPDEKISFTAPANLPTSAGGRTSRPPERSKLSSCSTLRARTGWGTRRIRNCSASTGRHFSPKKTWTTSCTSKKKPRSATIACSASSLICSPSRNWRGRG